MFKHRCLNMSIYFQVIQIGRKKEKGKGTWMGKGIGRGKNIWSLFANLGLRCVSKINQVSFLKMNHTQQS